VRPKKSEYYLKIASQVATRSTCLKLRLGAIIVDRDGVILSTGYNGPARGSYNCIDLGYCLKERVGAESGSYDFCPAVHAEENAIINAARSGMRINNAVLFLSAAPRLTKDERIAAEYWYARGPCPRCRRAIINAGLSRIVFPLSSWTQEQLIELAKRWFTNVNPKGRET